MQFDEEKTNYYTSYKDMQTQDEQSTEEAKGVKKSGGKKTGKTATKVVAAAVAFGLVASLTFTGTNYVTGWVSAASADDTATATTQDTEDVTNTSIITSDGATTVSYTTATDSSTSVTALDVSDVVEEVMPSIVSITCNVTTSYYGMVSDGTSSGSGIIVAQTSDYLYIVTNNHVVEDANTVTVTFIDGAEVEAEIKGTDSGSDLAILSIDIADVSADTLSQIALATLGDSDEISLGETAIVIGNALGYGQSVTCGVISAVDRSVTVDGVTYENLIQTDAAINPGNSGGALINSNGEVIGINSAKIASSTIEGIGYAIPISAAIPIINELIEREAVDEEDMGYLGIQGVDVTSSVASAYNMPVGVYISRVISNSAADAAGIEQGDILLEFDGKSITTMESLEELMQYYASGTTVDVVVARQSRDGSYEEITYSVTLGDRSTVSR